MGISIHVSGFAEAAQALSSLAVALPQIADGVVEQWSEEARLALKSTPYPPAPAGSRYVRTGKLASSWRKVRKGPGTWALQNYASEVRRSGVRVYSGFVLDAERQAWMHRGRWWTAQDRVAELAERLPAMMANAIMRKWSML